MIRAFLASAAWMIAGCSVILGLGFISFLHDIEARESVPLPHASGMVALTGGADRISDAVELFARGHADRLLITGVNQTITRSEIARRNIRHSALVDCCIDLGYAAMNTHGNAKETKQWVEDHKIGSPLIVVTSNYHMPRALAELHAQLPGYELIGYPVVSPKMRPENWWRSADGARVIITEYLKYIIVCARLAVTRVIS